LYSNLSPTLAHEPGSVWGAAALVAGTAVGAGILALPATTAPAGFAASGAALTAAAGWSALSGLLVAEVSVNTMCELGTGRGVSLGSMARRTLGPAGGAVVSVTYAVLHYSLLVAYIAKAGETLHATTGLPTAATDAAFTAALGALCFRAAPPALDAANYVLVGGVIATFLGLLAAAAGSVDPSALLEAHWGAVPGSLPVVALAFVFQNCVPLIASSLEGDVRKIRTAILTGVAVPYVMFMAWEAAILGSAGAGGGGGGGDPLAGLRAAGPVTGALVDAFTLLAIATSFIGFVLGLSEFVAEALGLPAGGGKAVPYALTLVPPLALGILYPDIFFRALDFAGTYGVLVLFGLVPAAMAWSERYGGSTLTRVQVAPGGRGVVVAVAAAAAAVILDQLLGSRGGG
jgi:tyrosine-specific transport protein